MKRSTNPHRFLAPGEREAVERAIAEAEQRTSAEIKVVLTRHCWTHLIAKAARIFRDLGLDQTERRNAAMVFVVTSNREFLVYGDEGIHEKVGPSFWEDCRSSMEEAFRRNQPAEALRIVIDRIGARLAEHFPACENDQDELSNEVVIR